MYPKNMCASNSAGYAMVRQRLKLKSSNRFLVASGNDSSNSLVSPIISNGLNLLKTKRPPSSKNSHQVATASKVRPPTKRSSSHAEGSASTRSISKLWRVVSCQDYTLQVNVSTSTASLVATTSRLLGQVEDWQAWPWQTNKSKNLHCLYYNYTDIQLMTLKKNYSIFTHSLQNQLCIVLIAASLAWLLRPLRWLGLYLKVDGLIPRI